MSREVWPGKPFPLGPMWDGEGTNFAIFSRERREGRSCACSTPTTTRSDRARGLSPRTTGTATCPASGPASATATASTAPTTPHAGHRFNPAKLLIDPYAKAIEGGVKWDEGNVHPYVPNPDDEDADLELDDADDSDAIPKCLVVDEHFYWEGDTPPNNPWWETVIYEAHVKGFTKQMEEVREDLRGTYAGLASEPAIKYLKDLGVTAVELLPVHHIIDESFLPENGLTNYWGYSHDRLLRAARRLQRDGHDRRAGARVQGHGQGPAQGGHRGHPRRRLQPHRRGQPPRPDAVLQGRRQRVLLPPRPRRRAPLHGLHGHGQHAQRPAPERRCG